MNIVNFIESSDKADIKKKLPQVIGINTTYCYKLIGKGGIGKVYIHNIGPTVKISFNDTSIVVPVVVKKAIGQGKFKIKNIKDVLYIYSHKDLTCEAIIMQYATRLWYKKVTPHVPLIVGYSKCEDFKTLVDTIITEKQGLDYTVTLQIDGFLRKPLFHDKPYNQPYSTTLATLEDLLYYIDVKKNDDQILLPNHQVCDIVRLVDYFTISFLHTSLVLYNEYKMVMNDMHAGNFFVHWLNDSSYLGDQNISEIKEIYYKVDDDMFGIETFGMIMKLGDIGSCMLNPKKDVWILGQGINLKKTWPLVDYHKNPGITIFNTFTSITKLLPIYLAKKTVIWEILLSSPYDEIVLGNPISDNIVERLLTPKDLLLNFFSKYKAKDNKKNSKNVLVI